MALEWQGDETNTIMSGDIIEGCWAGEWHFWKCNLSASTGLIIQEGDCYGRSLVQTEDLRSFCSILVFRHWRDLRRNRNFSPATWHLIDRPSSLSDPADPLALVINAPISQISPHLSKRLSKHWWLFWKSKQQGFPERMGAQWYLKGSLEAGCTPRPIKPCPGRCRWTHSHMGR